MINPQWKREAIQQELDDLGTEKQKLSRWLLATEVTSQAVRFINGQIEELTNKETRLQEQQWALEDQINELQKHSYDAGVIADQLKDFVCNFPQLQAGERKLLINSLIERVKIGKNKRVTATLRPPFASGVLSPSLPLGESNRYTGSK